MTQHPLYEVHNLVRVYSRGSVEVSAVDGVDLTVHAGELVAIEGTSGSGKSTLLAMLGGLDRPSSGSITFDGVELSSMNDRQLTELRAREIGFVFQGFNLIPTLSAVQNIEAVMAPLGLPSSAQRRRALELLDRVGLASRADHLPSLLSGGEQQRVAVARALANNPRVVLADEPTGNLDTATAGEVVNLLRSLTTDLGVTIVLVTHDRELASQAPRRIAMRDGRIVGQPRRIVLPADNVIPLVRTGWREAERATSLLGKAAATIAVIGAGAVILPGGSGLNMAAALKQTPPALNIPQTGSAPADLPAAHPTKLIAPAKSATVVVAKPVAKSVVVVPVKQTVSASTTSSATQNTPKTAPAPKPKPKPKPATHVTTPTPTPTPTTNDTGGTTTTTYNPYTGWPTTSGTSTGNPSGSAAWWWPWTTTNPTPTGP